MAGRSQDCCGSRWIGSAPAVDFHPDLDPFPRAIVAQLAQRRSEVLNSRFPGHAFRKTHGLNFDSQRACVTCEIDELFGDLHLLLALGRVGRLKSRGRAVAQEPDLALLE